MAREVVVLAALCVAVALGSESAISDVSDDEIKKLSETLFSLENNALAKSVNINLQGQTFSSATDDKAPGPMLSVKSDAAKAANPNVDLLERLYDNYEPDSTVAEVETAEEKKEQSDLLDGLMATPVLKETLKFLASKGLVSSDQAAQKKFLHKLWFTQFARAGRSLGSSAFEHVFLGEIKNNAVSGMHSWLYFNDQEEANKLDYKGYIKKQPLDKSGTLVKVRFTWRGADKPVNSLFIGTTPELELSLYTLCFLTRPDAKCPVAANGKNFKIQTYSFTLRDNFKTIGSAYPVL